MTLIEKYNSFVEQVSLGKEGIFFTMLDGKSKEGTCVVGLENKKDVGWEDNVFPQFCIYDFLGTTSFLWNFDSVDTDLNIYKGEGAFKPLKSFSSESEVFDFDSFIAHVAEVQELQKAGEMWVLNLARSVSGRDLSSRDFFKLYHNFLCLDFDSWHIGGVVWTEELKFACFSPEVFLRQQGNLLTTFPIKGTGERSKLDKSGKEISELNMIVDLLRNDLAMVGHSVVVDSPRKIVNFSDFSQALASVSCQLDNLGLTRKRYETLLPAGSISGAPKQRVMDAILKLEDFDRNFYTGTFGVRLSQDEAFFNVLIRTLFYEDDRWWFPVGAGITTESDPVAEYKETILKASLLDRVGLFEAHYSAVDPTLKKG